jgi:hypothetical protein
MSADMLFSLSLVSFLRSYAYSGPTMFDWSLKIFDPLDPECLPCLETRVGGEEDPGAYMTLWPGLLLKREARSTGLVNRLLSRQALSHCWGAG